MSVIDGVWNLILTPCYTFRIYFSKVNMFLLKFSILKNILHDSGQLVRDNLHQQQHHALLLMSELQGEGRVDHQV